MSPILENNSTTRDIKRRENTTNDRERKRGAGVGMQFRGNTATKFRGTGWNRNLLFLWIEPARNSYGTPRKCREILSSSPYKQPDSRYTHVRVKEYVLRKGFIRHGEIDHPPHGRNTIEKLRWNLLCAR